MPLTPHPLLVTLLLDPKSFKLFNQMRQQYFPPERNFLPAHITLFHSLPADPGAAIEDTLKNICSETRVMQLNFPQLWCLGQGVAIDVESTELTALQGWLARHWSDWLSVQDERKYHAHVTIQNKVKPEEALHLYNQLKQQWKNIAGQGEGLILWRYKGGPWELVRELRFKAG